MDAGILQEFRAIVGERALICSEEELHTYECDGLTNFRNAMYHAMMGENVDGKTAADWGLVNEALPLADLKARVTEVAEVLLKKNPVALKAAKDAIRRAREMTYDNAEDFLVRAQEAANSFDNEGRKEGIRQFIDEKSFRPGVATYDTSKRPRPG